MTSYESKYPVKSFMTKNPTEQLRFEPPNQKPPYQQASLRLKRLNIPSLDDAGVDAMVFFSWFFERWELNRERDIEDAKVQLQELQSTGPGYEVRTDTLPTRRFSGDGFLGRGRYYTVCGPGHDDGGTMIRELTAYYDPLKYGIMDLSESMDGGITGYQRAEMPERESFGDARCWLLMTIPPLTTYASRVLVPNCGQWMTTELRLPITIFEQSFSRLLDLRVPEAAAWFTHNLTRLKWLNDDGDAYSAFPNKKPLDDFTDLLPSLAAQDPGGGNGASRIAGQWLRALGAEALVFPSARSDTFVKIHMGEPADSYGWNLIDYRAAAPPRVRTFDLSNNWPRQVPGDVGQAPLHGYGDVTIRVKREDPDGGSWAWQNIERANRGVQQLATSIFLYRFARGDVRDIEFQQLVKMLGVAELSKQLVHRSASFIAAMLGDSQERRVVVDEQSDWPARDRAWLNTLANTFEIMDSRVANARAQSKPLALPNRKDVWFH